MEKEDGEELKTKANLDDLLYGDMETTDGNSTPSVTSNQEMDAMNDTEDPPEEDADKSFDLYGDLDTGTDNKCGSSYSETDRDTTIENAVSDLDLYDDILTEQDTQQKQSYEEKCKQYELARKLIEKLEAENRKLKEDLSKQTTVSRNVQKNMSSLLVTARGEIGRKDREINDLRKKHNFPRKDFDRNLRHDRQHKPGEPFASPSAGKEKDTSAASTSDTRNKSTNSHSPDRFRERQIDKKTNSRHEDTGTNSGQELDVFGRSRLRDNGSKSDGEGYRDSKSRRKHGRDSRDKLVFPSEKKSAEQNEVLPERREKQHENRTEKLSENRWEKASERESKEQSMEQSQSKSHENRRDRHERKRDKQRSSDKGKHRNNLEAESEKQTEHGSKESDHDDMKDTMCKVNNKGKDALQDSEIRKQKERDRYRLDNKADVKNNDKYSDESIHKKDRSKQVTKDGDIDPETRLREKESHKQKSDDLKQRHSKQLKESKAAEKHKNNDSDVTNSVLKVPDLREKLRQKRAMSENKPSSEPEALERIEICSIQMRTDDDSQVDKHKNGVNAAALLVNKQNIIVISNQKVDKTNNSTEMLKDKEFLESLKSNVKKKESNIVRQDLNSYSAASRNIVPSDSSKESTLLEIKQKRNIVDYEDFRSESFSSLEVNVKDKISEQESRERTQQTQDNSNDSGTSTCQKDNSNDSETSTCQKDNSNSNLLNSTTEQDPEVHLSYGHSRLSELNKCDKNGTQKNTETSANIESGCTNNGESRDKNNKQSDENKQDMFDKSKVESTKNKQNIGDELIDKTDKGLSNKIVNNSAIEGCSSETPIQKGKANKTERRRSSEKKRKNSFRGVTSETISSVPCLDESPSVEEFVRNLRKESENSGSDNNEIGRDVQKHSDKSDEDRNKFSDDAFDVPVEKDSKVTKTPELTETPTRKRHCSKEGCQIKVNHLHPKSDLNISNSPSKDVLNNETENGAKETEHNTNSSDQDKQMGVSVSINSLESEREAIKENINLSFNLKQNECVEISVTETCETQLDQQNNLPKRDKKDSLPVDISDKTVLSITDGTGDTHATNNHTESDSNKKPTSIIDNSKDSVTDKSESITADSKKPNGVSLDVSKTMLGDEISDSDDDSDYTGTGSGSSYSSSSDDSDSGSRSSGSGSSYTSGSGSYSSGESDSDEAPIPNDRKVNSTKVVTGESLLQKVLVEAQATDNSLPSKPQVPQNEKLIAQSDLNGHKDSEKTNTIRLGMSCANEENDKKQFTGLKQKDEINTEVIPEKSIAKEPIRVEVIDAFGQKNASISSDMDKGASSEADVSLTKDSPKPSLQQRSFVLNSLLCGVTSLVQQKEKDDKYLKKISNSIGEDNAKNKCGIETVKKDQVDLHNKDVNGVGQCQSTLDQTDPRPKERDLNPKKLNSDNKMKSNSTVREDLHSDPKEASSRDRKGLIQANHEKKSIDTGNVNTMGNNDSNVEKASTTTGKEDIDIGSTHDSKEKCEENSETVSMSEDHTLETSIFGSTLSLSTDDSGSSDSGSESDSSSSGSYCSSGSSRSSSYSSDSESNTDHTQGNVQSNNKTLTHSTAVSTIKVNDNAVKVVPHKSLSAQQEKADITTSVPVSSKDVVKKANDIVKHTQELIDKPQLDVLKSIVPNSMRDDNGTLQNSTLNKSSSSTHIQGSEYMIQDEMPKFMSDTLELKKLTKKKESNIKTKAPIRTCSPVITVSKDEIVVSDRETVTDDASIKLNYQKGSSKTKDKIEDKVGHASKKNTTSYRSNSNTNCTEKKKLENKSTEDLRNKGTASYEKKKVNGSKNTLQEQIKGSESDVTQKKKDSLTSSGKRSKSYENVVQHSKDNNKARTLTSLTKKSQITSSSEIGKSSKMSKTISSTDVPEVKGKPQAKCPVKASRSDKSVTGSILRLVSKSHENVKEKDKNSNEKSRLASPKKKSTKTPSRESCSVKQGSNTSKYTGKKGTRLTFEHEALPNVRDPANELTAYLAKISDYNDRVQKGKMSSRKTNTMKSKSNSVSSKPLKGKVSVSKAVISSDSSDTEDNDGDDRKTESKGSHQAKKKSPPCKDQNKHVMKSIQCETHLHRSNKERIKSTLCDDQFSSSVNESHSQEKGKDIPKSKSNLTDNKKETQSFENALENYDSQIINTSNKSKYTRNSNTKEKLFDKNDLKNAPRSTSKDSIDSSAIRDKKSTKCAEKKSINGVLDRKEQHSDKRNSGDKDDYGKKGLKHSSCVDHTDKIVRKVKPTLKSANSRECVNDISSTDSDSGSDTSESECESEDNMVRAIFGSSGSSGGVKRKSSASADQRSEKSEAKTKHSEAHSDVIMNLDEKLKQLYSSGRQVVDSNSSSDIRDTSGSILTSEKNQADSNATDECETSVKTPDRKQTDSISKTKHSSTKKQPVQTQIESNGSDISKQVDKGSGMKQTEADISANNRLTGKPPKHTGRKLDLANEGVTHTKKTNDDKQSDHVSNKTIHKKAMVKTSVHLQRDLNECEKQNAVLKSLSPKENISKGKTNDVEGKVNGSSNQKKSQDSKGKAVAEFIRYDENTFDVIDYEDDVEGKVNGSSNQKKSQDSKGKAVAEFILYDENTFDVIDYEDDLSLGLDESGLSKSDTNSDIAGGSVDKDKNKIISASKVPVLSDGEDADSSEEGELSSDNDSKKDDFDDMRKCSDSGKPGHKGGTVRTNISTRKPSGNIERSFSPIKFPSVSDMPVTKDDNANYDSSCSCVNTNCVHKTGSEVKRKRIRYGSDSCNEDFGTPYNAARKAQGGRDRRSRNVSGNRKAVETSSPAVRRQRSRTRSPKVKRHRRSRSPKRHISRRSCSISPRRRRKSLKSNFASRSNSQSNRRRSRSGSHEKSREGYRRHKDRLNNERHLRRNIESSSEGEISDSRHRGSIRTTDRTRDNNRKRRRSDSVGRCYDSPKEVPSQRRNRFTHTKNDSDSDTFNSRRKHSNKKSIDRKSIGEREKSRKELKLETTSKSRKGFPVYKELHSSKRLPGHKRKYASSSEDEYVLVKKSELKRRSMRSVTPTFSDSGECSNDNDLAIPKVLRKNSSEKENFSSPLCKRQATTSHD